MNGREMRDHIKKLLEISIELQKLALDESLSYQKAIELRLAHREAYKKWLFYKELYETVNKKEV